MSGFKVKKKLKLGLYAVFKHLVAGCVCVCVLSLTFFPPCFSTMSVLSGKWSSWGVLEPPPLGIVQLSPRQASFTLPLHRHQPSGTKRKGKKKGKVGEVSTWPLCFFENTFTHYQTMQPLAVHQALYFQPLHPCSGGRAAEREDTGQGCSCGRQKAYLFSRLNPKSKQGLPKSLKICLVVCVSSWNVW